MSVIMSKEGMEKALQIVYQLEKEGHQTNKIHTDPFRYHVNALGGHVDVDGKDVLLPRKYISIETGEDITEDTLKKIKKAQNLYD